MPITLRVHTTAGTITSTDTIWLAKINNRWRVAKPSRALAIAAGRRGAATDDTLTGAPGD